MPLKPITSEFAWYIFPGALVRNNDPKFKGRGILCIGPSSHKFADPEWTAIAPVVTELPCPSCRRADIMRGARGEFCHDCITRRYALNAEAHRVELQFHLKNFGVARRIETIPFEGSV